MGISENIFFKTQNGKPNLRYPVRLAIFECCEHALSINSDLIKKEMAFPHLKKIALLALLKVQQMTTEAAAGHKLSR